MNNKPSDIWGDPTQQGDTASNFSGGNTVNPAHLSPSTDKTCMKGSSFIGEYLFELWKNQCLCDVRLQVGDKSFLAHKIVLAAFSDVFCPSQPRIKPTVCIDVPGTTPDAIYQILLYLYTSEMHLTDCNLEPVLVAACFMGITDIVDMIRAILDRPTVENLQLYMDIRKRQGMKHSILDFPKLIKEHFADLIEDTVFLCITFDELETLLMNPNLMVNSEMDTVRAVIAWLEFNPLNRTQHTARLLELVNLEAVDTEALVRLKEEKQHLFEDAVASEIIMDAFIKRAKACAKKADDLDLTENNRMSMPAIPRGLYHDSSQNKSPTNKTAMIVEESAQDPYGVVHVNHENTASRYSSGGGEALLRKRGFSASPEKSSGMSRLHHGDLTSALHSADTQHNHARVPRSQYMEQEHGHLSGHLSRRKSPFLEQQSINKNMSKSPKILSPEPVAFYDLAETGLAPQDSKLTQDNILLFREHPSQIHQNSHSFRESKFSTKGHRKLHSPNHSIHLDSAAPALIPNRGSSKTPFANNSRSSSSRPLAPSHFSSPHKTRNNRDQSGSPVNDINASPITFLQKNETRSYRRSPYEKGPGDHTSSGSRTKSPPSKTRPSMQLTQLESSPRVKLSAHPSPTGRGRSASPRPPSWRSSSSPRRSTTTSVGARRSERAAPTKQQY